MDFPLLLWNSSALSSTFTECGKIIEGHGFPSFLLFLEIHVLLGEQLDIAKEKNVMLNVM